MIDWKPIAEAPKDRVVLVFAPGGEFDINDLVCLDKWHPDAGWCVCELRNVTHFAEYSPP